jgi:hypothetical protein
MSFDRVYQNSFERDLGQVYSTPKSWLYFDTRIHPEVNGSTWIYKPLFNLRMLTSTFRYDTLKPVFHFACKNVLILPSLGDPDKDSVSSKLGKNGLYKIKNLGTLLDRTNCWWVFGRWNFERKIYIQFPDLTRSSFSKNAEDLQLIRSSKMPKFLIFT